MSYEICKEKGVLIDYCELLCDAWLNDCLKFDNICKELEMLGGSHLRDFQVAGALFLERYPLAKSKPDPVNIFCKYMITKKKRNSRAFNALLSTVETVAKQLQSTKDEKETIH